MKIKSITAEVEWYPIYGTETSYAEVKRHMLRTDTFKIYGVERNGQWWNPTPHWISIEFDKRRKQEQWGYTQFIESKRVIDVDVEEASQ